MKYGSPSLAVLLADGYSLLPLKAKEISSEIEAVQDDTTGLGDAWPEHTPVGMQRAILTLGEAFYDNQTSPTSGTHDQFRASGATARVVVYAFRGDTIGNHFIGHQGALSTKYQVLGKVGGLTKAKIAYTCTGYREEGIILQSTTTQTGTWNTEGASSQDNGASSSAGGSGYLQVTAHTGFTSVVFKIRHSADDVTYADLLTFTTTTPANSPRAERVTVSGTVNRHLAMSGTVTGSGSITAWVGFVRN